jgi:hypothetical protein
MTSPIADIRAMRARKALRKFTGGQDALFASSTGKDPLSLADAHALALLGYATLENRRGATQTRVVLTKSGYAAAKAEQKGVKP